MAGLTVRLTTEPRIYRRVAGRLCVDVRRKDATLVAGPAARTDPAPPAPPSAAAAEGGEGGKGGSYRGSAQGSYPPVCTSNTG